ncbi:uncharacterized protein LOC116020149 [Ipomoea triloba]|uniref:uncharacterized protein LOC116020149 n=1 Tax=Ipomoea triloba TaxID=35885 RepID=UPI00125D44BF|nr:uncharacterized protein LOC116020149 [Ipomoea triloba]
MRALGLSVDIWIQLHGLPIGYTSVAIQEQIGNFIETFLKADERFVGAPWLDFYRIRVALPMDKPLKRRMKLLKRDKSWSWILFRYEHLHNFYFCCGMLGHVYKFCLRAREARIPVEQFPFGLELRAGVKRGPWGVGDSWLVPVGGPPRAVDGERVGSTGSVVAATTLVTPERQEAEMGVVAVSKRRREGSGGGVRRQTNGGGDVHMTEVSKNLHVAGSGSQTRPSS